MTFPASLTLVTVTVQADLLPSGGAAGTCRIFYDNPLTGDTVVPYVDVTATLTSGSATLQVPATNATGWAPVDFMYRVELRAGGRARLGTLQLDKANTAVDLADLIQWNGTVTAGVSYILAGQKGVPGGVAALDGTGQVLDGSGNPVTGGGGGGGTPSNSVTAETSYGASSSAGAATAYSRGDHTHGTPSLGSTGTTAAAGNHAHAGTYQPLDSDLTTIAGLTATTNNFLVSQSSAWASVNAATAKTALGIAVADVSGAAPLASPTFTGTPSLPTGSTGVTQSAGNNTTALATTAFVTTADALKADLASPTFSGTPSLPTGTTGVTQSAADSTTKLATTAFVTTADNLKANLASPTFTGTPAAPTAAAATNTTQLATTAFTTGAVSDHAAASDPHPRYTEIYYENAGTYGIVNGARIFVGPDDPSGKGFTPTNGDLWFTT